MKLYIFIVAAFVIALVACNPEKKDKSAIQAPLKLESINPAMPGFNEANSDDMAIALADSVTEAMGGRQRWDKLRYLEWNFFGARDLLWDKWTGNVRIDHPRDSTLYYVNVLNETGKIYIKGKELTDADSLATYINRGKSIWINDSYWLVMPFKLKDSGVTLTYVNEDTTLAEVDSHVLELAFKGVGDTPNNKYRVYIDKSDNLIKQWAFYREVTQDSASAIWPWDNYHNHDGLLLSYDRSDGKGPKDVRVYDTLPDSVFSIFDTPE